MILFQDRFIRREEAVVDIEDRGYQFGDGVYEVVRVYGGTLFGIDAHMERLARSVAEMRMALPFPIEEIKEKLYRLVEKNQLNEGIVYMQITRGTAPRVHEFPKNVEPVLTAYTKEMARPLEKINEGISALLVEDIRWLRCDIKSLNLLGNVFARQEALDHQCGEAIMRRDDTVSEGSSSNVFIVNGDELQTHSVNRFILNGITRKQVLVLADGIGLKIKEEAFTVDELLASDEVFITSTTSEITPVTRINDTNIGDRKPGDVTRQLQKAFEAMIPDPEKSI